MLKLLNLSVKAVIIILISGLLLIFSAFFYFSSGLPDYKKLSNYQPPISSRVYSKDGKLIAEYALEKRLFVPYDSIPSKIIDSFLSAEDKNFFNHPGVDAKGIIRATINNITNILGDKRLEGASTITQQVAKNFLLTNEVSIKRKIKEAILAFRIEKAYSKKRILELYLNQIYLGQGTYGVAAASLEYFDKSIKDLEYDEAALLAALPKAPSRYNPIKDPKEAKFRRDLVLKNLYQNGFINNEQYLKFKQKKIKIERRKIEIVNEANSYTEEVRRIIKNKYGFEKLYTQGLSIKSPLNIDFQIEAINALRNGIESYDRRHGWRGPITNKNKDTNWKKKLESFNIDPTLQWLTAEVTGMNDNFLTLKTINNENVKIEKNSLNWAIKKRNINDVFDIGDFVFIKKNKNVWSLKQYPNVNGGIVALNPFTGEVKALVGGFSYTSSEFNRVTQAKRQPGSAFKPFVYAAAIENGLSPNSIVLDAPFIAEQGIGLKDWKPENYGKKFYGPSTLRKGIEYSRNLMTVRIAQNVGVDKILNLSKQLEIYDEIPELLSVSLGSIETSLLNITSAYATFVNGGKKVKPVLINRIQDRRGKTIFTPENATCKGCDRFTENEKEEGLPKIDFKNEQVISEQTAYQITSILKGVITRGTGKKLRDLNVPLAGKTGTTNNNFDAWFIGYNSNLVVGVYIGFDNPKPLGKYETGSKAALPIFKNFIKEVSFLDDFDEFEVPDGIYFAPINYHTGEQTDFDDKNFILEAFKEKDINSLNNKQLISNYNYDKLIKFRQFY
tara:strand:+ start:4559 stop:6910 length:2352 start_codon:yes stop_codon:yes gene_type:complete